MATRTGLGTSSANQGSLGSFGQTIQAGLTKVSGNVIGITTIKDGPQPEAGVSRAAQTRFTTENLAYPLDVEEYPRQGHYIFFNINVQDKAKVAKQAIDARVKRLIYISSVKVNGEKTYLGKAFKADDLPNPQDSYAKSKYKVESELRRISKESKIS
jgi:dTDP-4-dehydrorhamnose reductase